MLKRLITQKRYFKHIYKEQKGITGLETAIILIAFVVVAAVFAYTVLSAGLFSTQKSQEAVYSGLQETQSTLKINGAVVAKAEGMAINGFESATTGFTALNGSTISTTQTAANVHEGTRSLDITPPGSAEAIGVHSMTARAFANGDTITFWAQLANTTGSGNVEFALSTSATLATTTNTVTITAADTSWHKYTMTLVAANDDAATYYGFLATGTDITHVYVDDLQVSCDANLYTSSDTWVPFGNKVIFTLSLANGGEPVDFTTGTDTDGDGLIDTHTNKVVINYNDSNQTVNDLAWSASFIGAHDSNNLLDANEKVQITVDLTYVNQNAADIQKLIAAHQFTLEVKPPTGAVLNITRTMPDKVNTINDLN